MQTDAHWTWTIIMDNGRLFHLHEPVSLEELLARYRDDGYELTEVEVIIRH